MGVWRLSILFLLSSLARAEASSLDAARKALEGGRGDDARRLYHEVVFGSEDWAAKLEDLIRHHLLTDNPGEAWRLCELAQRTRTAISDLSYYKALAATRARVCTLSHEVENDNQRLLLQAHVYRFFRRYVGRNSGEDAYLAADGGQHLASLAPHQTAYLAAIPKARLVTGRGCRLYKGRLEDRSTAQVNEFETLTAWYLKNEAERDKVAETIATRLLELSSSLKNDQWKKRLLERFKSYDVKDWLPLDDGDRRYVWQQLIAAENYPAAPVPPDHEIGIKIEFLILKLQNQEVETWMGLIDFPALSRERQRRLVTHALAQAEINHRNYLLLWQAYDHYEGGEFRDALVIVRRLVLEGASEGDEVIEHKAAQIAIGILGEFEFDETLLGAIQSALPPHTWGEVFRNLLVEHALAGHTKGFHKLMALVVKTKKENLLNFTKEERRFLEGLATRNYGTTRQVLAQWGKTPRLAARNLGFLQLLANRMMSLSDQERVRLRSLSGQIATYLKPYLTSGGGQFEQLKELVPIYDQTSAWAKGSETVRQGTVQAGVVKLIDLREVPYPFRWTAPASLPLRDLVYMPRTFSDREWILR